MNHEFEPFSDGSQYFSAKNFDMIGAYEIFLKGLETELATAEVEVPHRVYPTNIER